MKICRTCGRLLPDSEYQTGRNDCKYCRRGSDLKRHYGISNEQYVELWKKQGGKCALCGKEVDKYLDVDHSHTSYAIRGLLCRRCNLMLDELFEKNITEGKLKEYLNNAN